MTATIDKEPFRVFPNEKEANKVCGTLEALEDGGWTYEVIVSPKSGQAVIAVYDEDGDLLGNL